MGGIGHNSNAALGRSWRRHAWTKARKSLMPARVPIEIVRLRVKRAKALGLSYPQYASILLGSGRDIVGFLFTVGGLQVRLARELSVPDHVVEKLAALERCDLMMLTPGEEPAAVFREEFAALTGLAFASAAPLHPAATNTEARIAIRAALDPLNLPGDAVVMIGQGAAEAAWAEAGRLARFLPHEAYFTADGEAR